MILWNSLAFSMIQQVLAIWSLVPPSPWNPDWLWCSGEGNDNPPQYSCLENSVDRGASLAIMHGVAESDMTEQLTLHYLIVRCRFCPQCKQFSHQNRVPHCHFHWLGRALDIFSRDTNNFAPREDLNPLPKIQAHWSLSSKSHPRVLILNNSMASGWKQLKPNWNSCKD